MSGMKVKFYPFSGWEDKKMKESYLGRGKHFSFGIGGFQTHDINFINKNDDVGKVDRELITYELSFHMNNFSFQSEYFHFNGVVKDLSSSSFELGQSDGYYVHAEKFSVTRSDASQSFDPIAIALPFVFKMYFESLSLCKPLL